MKFVIMIGVLFSSLTAYCQSVMTDTLVDAPSQSKHWGYEAELQAGQVLTLDKYQKAYMIGKSDYSAAFKFSHVSLPSDSDAFAYDYHYPTFSIVAKFSKNNGATMHRNEDYPHWDDLDEEYYELAPYNTHLGNSFAIFGSFSYPLYRNNRWELAVCGNLGVAYSTSKYNCYIFSIITHLNLPI